MDLNISNEYRKSVTSEEDEEMNDEDEIYDMEGWEDVVLDMFEEDGEIEGQPDDWHENFGGHPATTH